MLTVGVDLAAEPERTAVARIEWSSGRARICDVICGADDGMILAAIAEAQKAGIDCPLGWPDDFVAFVAGHQARHVTVPGALTARAASQSLTSPPTARQEPAARTEGWIAVPNAPLSQLA